MSSRSMFEYPNFEYPKLRGGNNAVSTEFRKSAFAGAMQGRGSSVGGLDTGECGEVPSGTELWGLVFEL
jgi:hypothetical protein